MVATPETRSWTLEDVRRAIWLAYGGPTPERPRLPDLADHLGVSVRTVQRWLSGTNQPAPKHAQRLRELTAPPAAVLGRQRQERSHLEGTLLAMNAPRGRAMPRTVRDMGWHHPHRLWHLRNDELQLERLMVTRLDPIKPTPTPAGWKVIAAITFDNQPLALAGKYQVLDDVGPWRVAVRPELVSKGRHEVWLASAPTVDITELPH
ncbi:MAG: helix-turn-helix transcriptional regulator [Dermatophilaceae bacterium]